MECETTMSPAPPRSYARPMAQPEMDTATFRSQTSEGERLTLFCGPLTFTHRLPPMQFDSRNNRSSPIARRRRVRNRITAGVVTAAALAGIGVAATERATSSSGRPTGRQERVSDVAAALPDGVEKPPGSALEGASFSIPVIPKVGMVRIAVAEPISETSVKEILFDLDYQRGKAIVAYSATEDGNGTVLSDRISVRSSPDNALNIKVKDVDGGKIQGDLNILPTDSNSVRLSGALAKAPFVHAQQVQGSKVEVISHRGPTVINSKGGEGGRLTFALDDGGTTTDQIEPASFRTDSTTQWPQAVVKCGWVTCNIFYSRAETHRLQASFDREQHMISGTLGLASVAVCSGGGGVTGVAVKGLGLSNPVIGAAGTFAVAACGANAVRQAGAYQDMLKQASDANQCFNVKLIKKGLDEVNPDDYKGPPDALMALRVTDYRIRSSVDVCLDGI
jgi:hypothetical protein